MTALMLDLDGVLGDTRRLWEDWLADTSRVLGVDPALEFTAPGGRPMPLVDKAAVPIKELLA